MTVCAAQERRCARLPGVCHQGVPVLKNRNRGLREPQLSDPEFMEALRDVASGEASQTWQVEKKTRQYCRQVQRALQLALAEECSRRGCGEVFVDEVAPAPDCGRLVVRVAVPPGWEVEEALRQLREMTPTLRTEVAAAITRKRAPELYFVPVCGEGGEYE